MTVSVLFVMNTPASRFAFAIIAEMSRAIITAGVVLTNQIVVHKWHQKSVTGEKLKQVHVRPLEPL